MGKLDLRLDSVFNGKTKSCGCLQREMGNKKLEKAKENNTPMGTNIPILERDDSRPNRMNKTGYAGIWEDTGRGDYLVRIYFQKHCYSTRCRPLELAIATRKMMKRIHLDFLKWWYSLSAEERLHASESYHGEHDASWNLLKKQLDAYFEEQRMNRTAEPQSPGVQE